MATRYAQCNLEELAIKSAQAAKIGIGRKSDSRATGSNSLTRTFHVDLDAEPAKLDKFIRTLQAELEKTAKSENVRIGDRSEDIREGELGAFALSYEWSKKIKGKVNVSLSRGMKLGPELLPSPLRQVQIHTS